MIIKKILFPFITSLLFISINAHAEWVPFTLKNNHISIDIDFNGQQARAILDSGAEANAVSNFYVTRYNEGIHKSGKIIVMGISSKEKRILYSNVPIKLFGQTVNFNKLPAMNLSGAAILLGAPFFRQFIVQIDYPNSKLQLLPRNSVDMDKFKNVKIRRQRGSTLPAIEVIVNGDNVWLTFDTGNGGDLLMSRNYAIEKKWFNSNKKLKESSIHGVNSKTKTQSFNIPSLTIGPYELENIPVIIPAEGETTNIGRRASSGIRGRAGSKQTKGILGYDILKHFVVTIDYKAYKVHITTP